MQPLVDWVWHCGDMVATVVEHMEQNGNVRPGTFKMMQQLTVPADYTELISKLRNPTIKCTATRMKQCMKEILRKRWWSWLLEHPDLGTDYIHPSRSVFLTVSCLFSLG